jgi:hypothetical protein
MTISLAFLAPNLVKAAMEGRLPRGIGIERLRDAPTEWSRQREILGRWASKLSKMSIRPEAPQRKTQLNKYLMNPPRRP